MENRWAKLRKKMEKDNNSPRELLSNISEDIMKLKLILKLLEEET